MRFTYAGAFSGWGAERIPDESNFLLVDPGSGTTPAALTLGMNAAVVAKMQPGSIHSLVVAFTAADQTSASITRCAVTLRVPTDSAPSIDSVVNAASLRPFLSPEMEVVITGSHLTGPTLSTTYGPTGLYPTSVASTSVTFNGIAAPLLRVSPSRIKAIVPSAVAGQPSVEVVVQRFDQVSGPVTAPLRDTSPAIFTAARSGTGQGDFLQDFDGRRTENSPDNPAPVGATLHILATGAGVWAGTSTLRNRWSVLQVSAVIPEGVSSGPQPVVLAIGRNDSSQQQVTVAVQ